VRVLGRLTASDIGGSLPPDIGGSSRFPLFPGFEAPCLNPSTRSGPGDSTNCVTGSRKNQVTTCLPISVAPCLPISVASCLPMPKPRALPESLGSVVSSCAACAVPAAPPSADRRHPHVQLRCCSAYRRASSLEPTRRQRARAEPRVRRSLIAPPSTSSTCADRVVVRRVRHPGRTAERRPTPSSRSASLLLCLPPRQLTRANTTTASPRRAASTSFRDRAAVDLFDVRRSCRRAPRAPPRPHRRAPTDVILTFSFVAALPIAAPAH
jgi:hypothetical protein